jgi:hypothetical protein
LTFSGLKNDKFAAKFPEAGNWKLWHLSQFLDSQLPAAALPAIIFHSISLQSVPVGEGWTSRFMNAPP